ncbi:GNAT family N-acetyltransferase [Candidatus Binatia bacterium]|nr:GNAT family N-acetyltransferase [Candidatus Binatia bacterium]
MRRRADPPGARAADDLQQPTFIRRLERRDVPRLVRLLATSQPWLRLGYGTADWRRLLGGPLADRDAWVIAEVGRARGIAIVRRTFLAGGYLELLAIEEAARGSGLGARLLEHCENAVLACAPNFFVCVSDFNDGARRFYEGHGYVQVGRLDDLLIPGSAELLLRKTTGPRRDAPSTAGSAPRMSAPRGRGASSRRSTARLR